MRRVKLIQNVWHNPMTIYCTCHSIDAKIHKNDKAEQPTPASRNKNRTCVACKESGSLLPLPLHAIHCGWGNRRGKWRLSASSPQTWGPAWERRKSCVPAFPPRQPQGRILEVRNEMGDVKEILGLTQEKVEQPRTPFERVGKASGRDSAPPSSEKKRKRPSSLFIFNLPYCCV
jgi:hypothetical protein